MPALIYLIFSFTHVVIDTYKGLYNTAIIEIWIGVVFTLLLNLLCTSGLGIVSWLIISIPFMLMTIIASIILFAFDLDPSTGKAVTQSQPQQPPPQQPPPQQPPPQGQPPPPPPPVRPPSNYAYPISVLYA
jgi:hypothetical protein